MENGKGAWALRLRGLGLGLLGLGMFGVGCASGGSESPGGGEPLELGVRWSSGSITHNEVLEDAGEFLHRISTESYEGNSFVTVVRDYDVTDVSGEAPEQILRLSTATDAEEFSTWAGLRSNGAAINGEPPDAYKVFLRFEAVISETPVPGNGILELEPGAEALTIEWKLPQRDDELERTVELQGS